MKDFRNLKVWQRGHEITIAIYEATASFPQREIYGLVSQLRRSAASILANIAEGCGCKGNREFARFLQIALRSASETEYHLLLAKDLRYLENEDYEGLNGKIVEIKRMLTGLLQKTNADDKASLANS